MMIQDIPTPAIVIDASKVRRNVARLAEYAKQHKLKVRPHTKTHKSALLAGMQMEHGASGLTVAKVGEAQVMANVADDVLMAYPAVDPARCAELAKLARTKTIRVAIDSPTAADSLSEAAQFAGSTIGILVDLDVGLHRTGVQSPKEALALAQYIPNMPNLRLDGIMFYPGHVAGQGPDGSGLAAQQQKLREIDALLAETIDLWKRHGLQASIVSGGSTPTAYQSHLVTRMTEFRPGTYVFQDMNGVRGGFASIDECAARITATVVSTAVPGQFVIDAGSKTLTSDRCGPAPDSGHGYVVEYPEAKVTKLSEEHAQVDITACGGKGPRPGDRVTVIPNHICPCVNLQNHVWWMDEGKINPVQVDARGKVF
jgi:D-serine deaminase-like pyridoxal phosphate-dependent protein